MVTATFDISRFTAVMRRFVTELGEDARAVVKRQGGLLMRELVEGAPPKSLKRLKDSIDSDIKQVYRPLPKPIFQGTQAGRSGIRWLYATPHFLLGQAGWKFHPQDTGADLIRLFHKTKARKIISGPAWKGLMRPGRSELRGPQKLIELNRITVQRAALNELRRHIKGRGGRFKASLAIGWDELQVRGRRPPQWVMKHVHSARGRFINLSHDAKHPSITIVSNAPGVTKSYFQDRIRRALSTRIHAMLADLKNQLSGRYKLRHGSGRGRFL